MSNQVTFTNYKSTAPLSKSYGIENGKITKQAAAQMTRGTAKRVSATFAEFAVALSRADEKTAFGYGTHPAEYPDKVKIVCKGRENPADDTLARIKKWFEYQQSDGVLMLDHDQSEHGAPMTPEQLWAALKAIHPEIARAARIVRGSVSAGVHKVGEQPATGKGFHIYIHVKNAADIMRYGNVLFNRLWLAGYGYIALASNGALLIRTVIDGAVFSPERLDFVGRPIIADAGLTWTPPTAEYTEGTALDTETLPNLTDEECRTVQQLQDDAKAEIKPAAAKKQSAWGKAKIDEMTAAGVPAKKAREVIKQILSGGCKDLPGDFILTFAGIGAVSVTDVLGNPELYDGKACADAVEGVSYGTTTAKFYWNDGAKPFINSQAHGGCKYFLHGDADNADAETWQDRLSALVVELNKTHASVMIGGKHRVMRDAIVMLGDESKQGYEFIPHKEMLLIHQNTTIQVGWTTHAQPRPRMNSHYLAWATHKKCRTYRGGVVFKPGRAVPADCFNLWQGFAVEPKPGVSLQIIYNHMLYIVCDGYQDLCDYLIKWIAYTFQNPDKPAGAAIVLRGEKGSGKGTFGHFLRAIWGNHGLHIANAKHLVGNFNSHLADTCFLFADEAFYSGDKQHESVLKALITEPTLIVERKGIDAVPQPNYLKILMATNVEYAVPASRDERRYCVIDVSSERIGDREYFTALNAACNSKDVQAAFLYDMLHMDLTGFHTGDVPDSIGLREQRYHSLKPHQLWLADSLLNGRFDVYGECWYDELSSADLWGAYSRWADAAKIGEYRRVTQCLFGRYLSKVFEKTNSGTLRGYWLGNLDNAVKRFEAYEKVTLAEMRR